MMTYTEQLTLVQQAIMDLLTGKIQSYEIGNRTVTKLDLEVLTKYEQYLRPLAQREANGGGIPVQGIEPIV